MSGPEYTGFGSEDFEPEDALWAPGIDYVAGWRQATDAGAELLTALKAAGLDGGGITAQGHAAADGSGVVKLRLQVPAARALTRLVHSAQHSEGEGRAAS